MPKLLNPHLKLMNYVTFKLIILLGAMLWCALEDME
jgi:hypothetical protein